ncbi:MAG: YlxM family DNA-binding protein [bacterium]
MVEPLEEKQWIGALLDVYGGLLTDRQRDFLDLYFNEDLSYGEIAEAEDISRQAVHDTIQHGKKALLHFEEHLGLLARSQRPECAQPAAGVPIDLKKIQEEVQSLSALVGEDIIYDTGPLRRKVKSLRKLAGLE